MFDSHTIGISRLHFTLQCAVAQLGYWGLFKLWGSPSAAATEGWATGTGVSLLLLAVALVEMASRHPAARIVCALSKAERWSISHRQMFFNLGLVTACHLFTDGRCFSAAFLVSFVTLSAGWIAWSNLMGFRLLHRHLYRRWTERSRAAIEAGAGPAVARHF